jgi:hypothetical protein
VLTTNIEKQNVTANSRFVAHVLNRDTMFVKHLHARVSGELTSFQCQWGTESAKKPHNKQYVDSLRTRNIIKDKAIESLKRSNKLKDDALAKYRATYGTLPGLEDIPTESPELDFGYGSPESSSSADSGLVKTEDVDDEDITAIAAPLDQLRVC